MKLYHGSNLKVKDVDLEISLPNKDFGKGFYLSDSKDQALDMAKFKATQLGGNPEISVFEFDIDGLKSSNLTTKFFDEYSEEWVDFIIYNRMVGETHNFDFVYGPIANDKVGRALRLFSDEDISKEQLIEKLKYFKGITFQYYFGTEKALQFLRSIKV